MTFGLADSPAGPQGGRPPHPHNASSATLLDRHTRLKLLSSLKCGAVLTIVATPNERPDCNREKYTNACDVPPKQNAHRETVDFLRLTHSHSLSRPNVLTISRKRRMPHVSLRETDVRRLSVASWC